MQKGLQKEELLVLELQPTKFVGLPIQMGENAMMQIFLQHSMQGYMMELMCSLFLSDLTLLFLIIFKMELQLERSMQSTEER
uniref:Uncharacterized protein n=1 Tax=Picea sitchensis TaxID=3332 RepID=A9NM78_PICSI|nr:unknown [Picea sitchensis]